MGAVGTQRVGASPTIPALGQSGTLSGGDPGVVRTGGTINSVNTSVEASEQQEQSGQQDRQSNLRAAAGKAREKFRPGGIGSDTVWALGIEVLLLAASVLSFALLGSGLGAEGYGDYVAIFAITGMFGTLSGAGTGLSLIHHALREKEDLSHVVRSCLTFAVGTSILLGAVALPVLLAVVDSISVVTAICFIGAELVATPFSMVASDILRVHKGFGAASRLRMVSLAARVLLLVVLFSLDALELDVLGPSVLVLSLVIGLSNLRYAGRVAGIRTGFARVQTRHARTAGLYAVGLTALAVQNDGDKAVLAANATGPEAGIYAAAYKIVQFGLVPMNSLMSSSHQRFLEHDEDAQGQHVKRTLKYSLVAAVYGVVFAIGTFLAAPLLTRLLGDEFADATDTIRLLAPMVLARSVSVFALNGLLGLGKTAVRTGLLIASAGVSFAMYLVLIPSMGSTGAVLGTLISEGLVAVVAWVLLTKFQRQQDRQVVARLTEMPG